MNRDNEAEQTKEETKQAASEGNGDDGHAFYESYTRAQAIVQAALITRLEREKFTGSIHCNCHIPIPTGRRGQRRFKVRAPDFLFIRHGVVVEIDGSAHDALRSRVQRDLTREYDWSRLGFVCLRLPDSIAYDLKELARALDDIIGLLRNSAADPRSTTLYQNRRQRLHRARTSCRQLQPETDLGANRGKTTQTKSGGSIRCSERRWHGLVFTFLPAPRTSRRELASSD